MDESFVVQHCCRVNWEGVNYICSRAGHVENNLLIDSAVVDS